MNDKGHEDTDKLIAEIEKKVRAEYKKAFDRIETRLDEFAMAFAAKDKKMQQKVKDGKLTKEKYKAWLQGQLATSQRWQEMRNMLAADICNANKIARSIVKGYMPEAYALNVNYATYLIETGLTVQTNFTLYNRTTVEHMLREDPELLPMYSETFAAGKDIAYQKRHLQSLMTQSVLTGESIPKIAKRIYSCA